MYVPGHFSSIFLSVNQSKQISDVDGCCPDSEIFASVLSLCIPLLSVTIPLCYSVILTEACWAFVSIFQVMFYFLSFTFSRLLFWGEALELQKKRDTGWTLWDTWLCSRPNTWISSSPDSWTVLLITGMLVHKIPGGGQVFSNHCLCDQLKCNSIFFL